MSAKVDQFVSVKDLIRHQNRTKSDYDLTGIAGPLVKRVVKEPLLIQSHMNNFTINEYDEK